MKWMLITVIAPEFLIGKYWADISESRRGSSLQKWARDDEVPWTPSHSLFANMGGFCLRTYAPERVGKRRDVGSQTFSGSQDGVLQGKSAQQPPKSVDLETAAREASISQLTNATEEVKGVADPFFSARPMVANPYHLDMKTILELRCSGYLTQLPYVSLDEIQDRSKSDSFVRLIAIGQILWIIIQVLARAIRHLAVSQLEIAVLAFACCAIVMYGLNWNKPKDVGVPITILSYPGEAPVELLGCLSREEEDESWLTDIVVVLQSVFENLYKNSGGPTTYLYGLSGSPISNAFVRSVYPDSDSRWWKDYSLRGFLIGSVVFGGIHLAAWNFNFPTRIEQILWWSAALWCTCFSVVLPPWELLAYRLGDAIKLRDSYNNFIRLVVPGGLYFIARLYLLVETIRTLCFLPPDAYIATWATNVPHIG